MKRLVVCCDGTWNRVDQESDGKPCPTNVVKLAYRVARRDAAGNPQVLFYDQGVGTGNILDKYSGGALGRGLEDNIWDAYRFLVANYEEGDAIYVFGFSRGAFTARSIVGMIRKCGILDRLVVENYSEAIRIYRSADHPDEPVCRAFRASSSVGGLDVPPTVRMLGVWDTVGALGIPVRGLRSLTAHRYKFHDTELSNIVERAHHALAIDERRAPFEPSLWNPSAEQKTVVRRLRKEPGAPIEEQELKQVVEQRWFAGVHTDVGGGYPETGLSDITLQWMIDRAADAGLAFDAKVMERHPLHPSSTGALHNSKTGLYRVTKGIDREIGLASKTAPNPGEPDASQLVDETVRERWRRDRKYRPPQLRAYFERTGDAILQES